MKYNRRQFLKKTGVFAIAGGVMPVAKVWGAKSRSVSRPNIIYLMSDDQPSGVQNEESRCPRR